MMKLLLCRVTNSKPIDISQHVKKDCALKALTNSYSLLEILLWHFIQDSLNYLGILGEGGEFQVAFKILAGFG